MELIEIQAAIEALKSQLLAEAGTNLAEVGTATATLINLPPAQPEIVYCKDCARYDSDMCRCESDVADILGYGRRWEEDDFCSQGIGR